jgi:voltage-gated potassium channel
MYGPIALVRNVYRQLLVLLSMFIMGGFIFGIFEHLPPLDALLASVSTITTIGLYVPNGGDFLTLNRTEALLLILMIIISVGAGASVLQSTVNSVVNGDMAKGEADKRLIARLKNHVIIYGYTHMGRYVADKLEELGLDYVVISRNPAVYQELINKNIFAVIEHETQPIEALTAGGVDKASMIIVSHTDDSDNMLFVLSARKMRPDIRIVTVVHDSNLMSMAKNAGADVIIPASVTVGHLLALSAVTKDIVGVVFSEKIGTKEIAEFSIFKKSPLIGKGLKDIGDLAVVVGVIRNEQVIQQAFDPNFRLEEGDMLLVLGDPSKLQILEKEAEAT